MGSAIPLKDNIGFELAREIIAYRLLNEKKKNLMNFQNQIHFLLIKSIEFNYIWKSINFCETNEILTWGYLIFFLFKMDLF